MKSLITSLALAASTLLAADVTPAQFLNDSPSPERYLYGVTRTPGAVKMRIHIDDRGKVRNVQVKEGRTELVAAAIRMVMDYRYQPAQSEGHAVQSDLDLELNFRFAQ